jgi:taurine dioxygenase
VSINVRRLGHALGAEVSGVDLGKELTNAEFDAIHRAFLEHHVLVFRNQPIDAAQHAAFSRRFGPLDQNEGRPQYRTAEGQPEVFLVVNKVEAPTARLTGADWHSDDSHQPDAAMASLLRCIELPGVGGDTLYCNMYMAYDALSDTMKKMLEPLNGVHMQGSDYLAVKNGTKSISDVVASAHPIVRVHPETGRKSLYMNPQVRMIEGMTADESQLLITYLSNVGTHQRNVYRHVWQQHDLVMWDNRCLLHMALADFDRGKIRHMERTTVRGHVSGHRYHGPVA